MSPIRPTRFRKQQGTDFDYINELAARSATCSTSIRGRSPGMSIGYWGPEIKVGGPQPALSINMDAHTNVESLSFTSTARWRSKYLVTIIELIYARCRFRSRSRTSRR